MSTALVLGAAACARVGCVWVWWWLVWGWGSGGGVGWVSAGGALLGPEAITACLWVEACCGCVLWSVPVSACPWMGAGGCRGRLLVENCTVDASIFVFKLLRAHGGCLGTRSR